MRRFAQVLDTFAGPIVPLKCGINPSGGMRIYPLLRQKPVFADSKPDAAAYHRVTSDLRTALQGSGVIVGATDISTFYKEL